MDITGAVSAFCGIALMAVGVLFGVPTGIRLLFVIRRPGKGRLARALAAFGLVLFVCGGALYAASDLPVGHPGFRQFLDGVAMILSGVFVLVAIWAGFIASRKPRAARAAAEPTGRAVEGGEKDEKKTA